MFFHYDLPPNVDINLPSNVDINRQPTEIVLNSAVQTPNFFHGAQASHGPKPSLQSVLSVKLETDFSRQQPIILVQDSPPPLPSPITPPPRPPEQSLPTPQPSPDTPLDLPPELPLPEESSNIPGTIVIRRFEFEGNTAFSDDELSEATAQFTQIPITFAQLLEAEAAVAKIYTDAGYINSGAVIPADQTFPSQGAVVTIQIVEGGIEDIRVTGLRRLNPGYVRSRVALATAKPLNRDRLLEALQLLQLDPLIQSLSAELSAGSRPDLSLLEVEVVEADSFRAEAFVNNGRSPSVGSIRRGVRLNEANLIGFGDGIDIIYTNTDGSNALDLSYTAPVNPRNGALILAGGFSDTEVIEPPFDRIDITGDSRYFELGFRQPVIQTPTQELALRVVSFIERIKKRSNLPYYSVKKIRT